MEREPVSFEGNEFGGLCGNQTDGCYSAAVRGTLIQAALPLDTNALSSWPFL